MAEIWISKCGAFLQFDVADRHAAHDDLHLIESVMSKDFGDPLRAELQRVSHVDPDEIQGIQGRA